MAYKKDSKDTKRTPRSGRASATKRKLVAGKKDAPSMESKSFLSQMFSSPEYNAVPLALTDKEKTAQGVLANLNMAVSVRGMIIDDLYDSKMQQIMNAYSAKHGYITDVTASDVTNYIQYAASAYAAYLQYLRAYATRNLETERGGSLGNVFGRVPSGGYTAWKDLDSLSTTTVSTVIAYSTIDNSQFEELVAKVAQLQLPARLKSMLEYLFSGHFVNPYSKVTGFVTLWSADDSENASGPDLAPIGLTGRAYTNDIVATALAKCDALLQANADLSVMLDLFGVNHFDFIGERDKTGTSMPFILDMDMIEVIVNSNPYVAAELTDGDYSGVSQELDDVYTVLTTTGTVFNPERLIRVPQAQLKLSRLGQFKMLHTSIIESDNSVNYKVAIPVSKIIVPTGTSSVEASAATAFAEIGGIWNNYCNLPFVWDTQITVNDTGFYNSIGISTTNWSDGYRMLNVAGDVSAITKAGSAELVFGQDYFSSLNALLNAIRSTHNNPIKH
jgi:hypothetical protein